MIVLVPEAVEARLLQGFPEGVEIAFLPKEGPLSEKALQAEFAVAPYGGARRFFAELPNLKELKVVQTLTAGVDWILPYLPPGLVLCDAAGVHDIPVSEWIVAAILSAIKRFPEFRDAQHEQRWAYRWVDDLEGSTVLFLGYGSIARATEERLAPFGVSFLRVARTARPGVHTWAELPELLPKADVIVNLLPYTPQTDKLVGAAQLALMKPGVLFVNAGRGKTVDQEALVEAIRAQRVRLVTDVTAPEPLPEGHPLWSLPEVFLTPHIAGSTPKLFERGFRLVREQVARYLRGEPLLNVVTDGY
ncbi:MULTISPECIES: 2-hydroxyacid dehydrogenase [Meiothermus]|uniref:D-isomer specific 2-hydroxyacid dehydrogenase NAD-binding protein n=1 Tax=Meiothermus ruber (strain ATCC 35948 / DSM 1279 / VKM B-1258 / 21) TaxID=504728 RepID=D3PMK0_MEIRD|nr:2-hydroxyacid dehydrogenase [Meiothermus ruber]ADD27175.1 D-isomer specific 2-hydroxyacid dehydrogenase NAD-binding protein [Meiothermus ruber DSM 1279]AGK03627.1 D-isomer specific 2-hydroxyacid dehydrogenase NAD-binding protein [Meiothermus ruber DSM 1279]GAO74098.1 D-isomer specific 2-hydroxyacid dehydrogenase NAD-binding protein [Meiothermus ruber H328]GIW32648.1 MAG: dehydrogenase [Meiothermus sp.]